MIYTTNLPEKVVAPGTVPPLQLATSSNSNHGCVLAEVHLPPEKDFIWVVKHTRKRSRKANEKFCRDLKNIEWAPVVDTPGVYEEPPVLE